jgi:hypothetical protein
VGTSIAEKVSVIPHRPRHLTRSKCYLIPLAPIAHAADRHSQPPPQIGEFIATGCVAKIAAQTTEDLAVTRLFQGIHGVGPQTAYGWYVRGLRTLADVRNRVGGIALSNAQELGLAYYADLQRRMPRGEAAEIFERIKTVGEFSFCTNERPGLQFLL